MHTEILKVTGMTCGGCTTNVTNALKAIPGVSTADVSLSAGEASVRYDERIASPGQLEAAVKGAGYGVGPTDATGAPPAKGGCCN